MSSTDLQRQAAEKLEDAMEAREWLDSMRREVIDTCQTLLFDIERMKQAASDASKTGVRVRRSDLLDEAMEDAMKELQDFHSSQGEWSS